MNPDRYTFPDNIEEYLEEHNVLNLATSGEDGPWSAAVFYAHYGRRFYFMSDPATTHGSHIVTSELAAASIHEDYADWQSIKGLQMSGRAWEVTDSRQQKIGLRAYFRKYSFAEAFFKAGFPERIAERMKKVRLFCFEPDRVFWLDNSKGFGKRITVYPPPDLPASEE